jgi:uncharacterized metal-binding protein YceD (DUF177 family)
MKTLNVGDLLAAPHKQTRLSASYTLDDPKSAHPVLCQWFVHVGDVGIGLRGEAEALLEAECARCLTPFQLPVTLTVNEQLVFSRFTDAADDSFAEVIDEDSVIDLEDLVRQYLVMETANQSYCGISFCKVPVNAQPAGQT